MGTSLQSLAGSVSLERCRDKLQVPFQEAEADRIQSFLIFKGSIAALPTALQSFLTSPAIAIGNRFCLLCLDLVEQRSEYTPGLS
ncbi:hypothetical protein E2320_016565 [Naja naja]|nr:hypothetical protein E2320_016565 [Naja naja]